MAAAIRCENLSKRYGEVTAVDDLNLTIPSGVIFGFLGRNGAGKTSTIRLLTGLARPTSGNGWLNGVPIDSPNSRQQYGYLPQEPSFYNWMTPTEFLTYVADLFQMGSGKKQRVNEMLSRVGLAEAAKRTIGGFSGGMMQRLGIAQAMLHKPKILFLDEPTSALDPAGRYELLTLIEGLKGETTIFLSSHILADVERVCDSIGIIHNGRLLRVENCDTLLNEFATDLIHLDINQHSTENIPPLVAQIEQQPWVAHLRQATTNQLQVAVHDTAVAQQRILPLLVEHQIELNKFEWQRPSLEDVFLQLSEAES